MSPWSMLVDALPELVRLVETLIRGGWDASSEIARIRRSYEQREATHEEWSRALDDRFPTQPSPPPIDVYDIGACYVCGGPLDAGEDDVCEGCA